MNAEQSKQPEEAPMTDTNTSLDGDAKVVEETTTESTVEMESSEVKGSSMGGNDPRADKKPTSNLVRSFGKWAKGKQHVCVRVLTTHHPELCAGRPGGCNGLCAYMKDQWAHTTKWRTGNKKNLVKKVAEGFIDLGDGEEFILPYDLAIEAMAIEADIADGKRDWAPRPDWFGDEEEALLIKLLEDDTLKDGESTEADISYDVVRDKVADLVRNSVGKKANDSDKIIPADSPTYTYTYVKDVFPGYVIYAREYNDSDGTRECDLYKQQYTVASGKVSLVGDPSKVVQTYVAAESDVDEPVSNPIHWDGDPKERASIEGNVTSDDKETEKAPETNLNDKYIMVASEGGTLVVETDDSGTIVAGPDSLIGKVVPAEEAHIEQNFDPAFEANESQVTESGILKGAGISEVEVSELVIQEAQIMEATTAEELKTPNGLNVDAIIRVIVPGPGNAKDRFYYTPEAIESSLKVFDGKKMYKDHTTRKQDMEREGQPRKTDDWVATVEETWVDKDGVGYGGITFVDDAFQAKAKKGMRHLGVSVRGRVKARPGRVGGNQYNVVEGFTYGGSVDFVTEAGAGGGLVSIAESAIMEGNMDPKEMTLDQLMETVPAVFVEYAERLKAESKEGSTTEDTETVADTAPVAEGLTLEKIAEMLDSKLATLKTEIKSEVQESLAVRDVQDNRMIAKTKLEGSKLPKATKARLQRELHDVTFDGVDATESEPAKTPLEVFSAHVDAMIAEAEAEIREATSELTVVDDGGAGELVVTESGRIYEAKPKGVLDKINSRLGVTMGASSKVVTESATADDEASAQTS